MNLLFVCSKNKWRSRTAETIFKTCSEINVKSAGTHEDARIKLTEKHLLWADIVFVMENKHRQIIKQKFPEKFDTRKFIVLHIPDEYKYMDEELILTLKTCVNQHLENDI